MGQKLAAIFENSQCSLLKVEEDQFFEVNVTLVEEASGHNTAVIYVATKKPYLMLKKELQQQGVKTDTVHFVDCIIKTVVNEKIPEEDDVLYLERTEDLRNISTAVSTKAQSMPERNAVLVIDSLAALFTSHSTKQVADFISDLQERLETIEMNLVLFDEGRAVEEKVGKEIYDIVDDVLFLRGDT
jgi:KaiC/GvpD/RAD55 family RecA-like ATPase